MTHPPPGFRRASTPWISIQELVLPPNFAVPAHEHSPPHMLVMLAGSLSERDGECRQTCDTGSLRYSPGGDAHREIRIGASGAHCLIVEAHGFPELRLVSRVYIQPGEAQHLVTELAECLYSDACTSPAQVEARALAPFTFARARSRSLQVTHHEWILKVREWLDTLGATSAPLAQAAKHVERNASVVSRTFRAIHGVSVHHYYRRRQIDCAWDLVATSELSIAEIAVRAGFSDQSHLSRVFTQACGTTPRQLRAAVKSRTAQASHWYRSAPFQTAHS